MKKRRRKIINLLRVDVEKKVTFQYNGEQVQFEVLKSPVRNEFFTWLTTSKGRQNEMSFPRVELTRTGIRASKYCLGKDLKVFIPYEEINPRHLVTELNVVKD